MEKYRDAILKDFETLVSLDAVSFREREVADFLVKRLEEMGFTVTEDDAGAVYGGNAGNLYGYLKGTLEGDPVLFSGHMDVVEPGCGKRMVVDGDRITSAGDTVLGADDINGILEILYGIQAVLDSGKAHRNIEVLFTIGEELYTKGASVFDYTKIRAKEAYVLDLDGEIGRAAYKAPSLISFAVEITGKSAHAGFCPEQGIHAIQIAAEIITGLQQGHIGDDTTFNVGVIEGGTLTNIVPDKTVFRGEIRSYDHQKALDLCEQTKKLAHQIARKYGASSTFIKQIHLKAYETKKTAPCVKNFQQAAHTLGLSGELTQTFGGSDNNPFAEHGIKGLVLSNGMHNPHSVNEYTTIHELLQGIALVQHLILS